MATNAPAADRQHGGDIETKFPLQHVVPPPIVATPTVANPGPLGLCGFALTTFTLGLHNAGIGISPTESHDVVLGLAIIYGGLVQLLAGMWEFKTGNTFGATAFCSYGAYWMSYGLISLPAMGLAATYSSMEAFNRSLGYFMLSWTIFTGLMLVGSHRSSIGLVSLFFFLFLTYVMTTASLLNNSVSAQIASGAFGMTAAIIAWYNALSGLLTKDSSYFLLPVGRIGH
ncbi:GPR1/FUN34/yaaH family-domain-containing protein [Radiomyces spectabilis]|uniref:GPR1/FUN34/yaaH family-domain-containing protein n=1 Tax=Radiomyces spectabilis TaxID=64574 RepID=UPI00221E97E6|nr:GPR1/FUN34/yaaH family-domain-containing protein [Radiomyces spectabilis]KAI8368282.1 GPR1/FUN34/yaaH family-domain-containing protein [Radiomyces spectabilis]